MVFSLCICQSGAFTLNISGSRRRRRRRAVPLSDTCKDNLQVMTHCPSHSSNGEAGGFKVHPCESPNNRFRPATCRVGGGGGDIIHLFPSKRVS